MLIEARPIGPSTVVPGRKRAVASAAIHWLAGCLVLVIVAMPGNVRAQAAPAAPKLQQAQPQDAGKSGSPPASAPAQPAPAQPAPAQGAPAQKAPAQGTPAQAAPAQAAPAQAAPAEKAPPPGTPAKAVPQPAQTPGSKAEAPGTETPAVVIDEGAADTLLGKPVQSTNGDDMGRVIDVVVDRSGMVRAAIIDFGGFLGIGTRDIAVDWRLLHFSKNDSMQTIVADLSRNQLRTAPVYKPGEPIVIVGRADAPPAAAPQPAASAAAPAGGQAPAPAGGQAPAPTGGQAPAAAPAVPAGRS